MFNINSKARDDWRKINDHIHKEEQQLKELQLDYNEKVAVVEALKVELRQIKHDMQGCDRKEGQLAQLMLAGYKTMQELQQQWDAVQQDRTLLAQQLATEQEALKNDKASIDQAKADFEEHIAQQHGYMQKLQEMANMMQPIDTRPVVDTAAEDVQHDAAAAEAAG